MSPPLDRRRISRVVSRGRTRLAATARTTLAAAVVSLLTATTTFVVASAVFTHHSVNHDEAVYLTQAAMLLDRKSVV